MLSLVQGQEFEAADYGNVILHLQAGDLNQLNDTEVTEWGNLSAEGENAPRFVAADPNFNGQPVVLFDGANDVMKHNGAGYFAQTVFAVVSLEADAGNLAGLISDGSDGLNIRRHNSSLYYRSPAAGMDNNDFAGNGSPTGDLQVNQVSSGAYNPGEAHLVMAVAGQQKVYSDFWIGSASNSLGRHWQGNVAEILIYDGELSQSAIDRIGWYLQEKYDLPTNFPSVLPEGEFSASSGSLVSSAGLLSTAGAPITLSWEIAGADSLSIDQEVLQSTSQTTGSAEVSPTITTTYKLSASNPSGLTEKSITIYIGETPLPAKLNEFLASNSGGLRDEDGDSSDWIEIYNPNPFAIDLAEYLLQDSSNEWAFPVGSMVEADGYRIVFSSSKNRRDPAGNLHTNFGISADGEYLALRLPDGSVATEYAPSFPTQRSNISYGLTSTGGGFFATPSPGEANTGEAAGVVADVEFSMPRGVQGNSFQLSLSTPTPGATIRYTMDASTPTETNGIDYSAPLTIASTRTIRARAFYPDYISSTVATNTYLFPSTVINGPSYAPGSAPAGWPTGTVNGQVFRYGWNASLKSQYTTQQMRDGLQQIPSLSIVTDQSNLTGSNRGIYVNAGMKGDQWEVPSSIEYLPADGGDSYQINAGLRVRGGASRGANYPKHSLRLHFRGEYGAGTMKFPIHGASGTDEFDTLDLRTEQNYHYANDGGNQNTAVREVFCRDLIGAMGQPTTRSTYLHLYLNGHYWGLYETEERAQEDYGASYFGGKPEDYDVIQTSNHPNFTYELSSGEIQAWQTMWGMARSHAANPTAANYFALSGRDATGQRVPTMPVYVDVDHLINYMLLHYYTGDGDGPLSAFLGMNAGNNWRGMRNRLGTEGFRFFVHDSEHTLQTSSWVDNRANNNTTSGSRRSIFNYSNPEWLHEDLAVNPEYRLRFADIAQKHLFNGGAMTPAAAQAIFDARAAQISQAIIPDIVRWGTSTTNHSLEQWQGQLNGLRSGFFPNRPANLINQLKSRAFFPNAAAPIFSQRGGRVDDGFLLTLDAGEQTGTIYYTVDGSDPRALGGGITGIAYTGEIPIGGLMKVRARFRTSTGVWSALDEAEFIAFPPAEAGDLVVSKIHYHPTDPTLAEEAEGFNSEAEFEYVELMNIGGETVDLYDVSIGGGIAFNFSGSTVRILPPGGRVIVAGNEAALQFRYGPGLMIAGVFSGDLSNGGEILTLTGAGESELRLFAYDDSAPWPLSPDGGGFALALRNPVSNPDHGLGTNWRASLALGGRPGQEDKLDLATWRAQFFDAGDLEDPAKEASVWGNEADHDGDGFANILEMALGTSPTDGSSHQTLISSWWTDPETSQRYLTLTCLVREELAGLTIRAEASSDLDAWPDVLPQTGEPVSQGDGMALITFRDLSPADQIPQQRRFLRLVVEGDE